MHIYGPFQLRIETGRYVGESIHDKICSLCNSGQVEDESHFICYCNVYTDIRRVLLDSVLCDCIHFQNYTEAEQFKCIFECKPRQTAKYLFKAFMLCRSILYSS